jgi:glutathione S-transferase
MKLFHSPASPFVRKVMVIAHETGQTLELLACKVTPVQRDEAVAAGNPLSKIPTLLTDDGPLYDSRVIGQYLDAQHDGAKMYPDAGPARWTALRREALADGLLEAALLARYEKVLRAADKVSAEIVQGYMDKIAAALVAMDAEAGTLVGVDAGTIATGCALGYLDFRYPDYDWRSEHPALAAWFEMFSARASMAGTLPHQ